MATNVENLVLQGAGGQGGAGNALNNVITGGVGLNIIDGLAGHDTIDGGDGNDIIYGGDGNDSLVGGIGNDSLTGDGNSGLFGSSTGTAPGNDVYRGGVGADSLVDSSTTSNDTFIWGRGEGADTLSDAGGTDQLSVLAGVTSDQVWLRHVGNNLEISVIGTSDTFTVNNWYTATANQVESIQLSDGKTLASGNVQNLVNAMASFTPPAAGQTTLPANYQTSLNPVIAANWA